MRRLALTLAPIALISTMASAHPHLLSSTPAADATVSPTNRIEMKFSQNLVAQVSGATLDMTEMPGMAMNEPMHMKISTTVSPDGSMMIATLKKPLPKGTYKLSFHAISADTHRTEGSFNFRVQ